MFRKTKGGNVRSNGDVDKSIESVSASLSLGNASHLLANDCSDQQLLCCPDDALIYSAPTVDTLGDEESLSRLYHSPTAVSILSPAKNHKPAKVDSNNNSLPPNTTPLMRKDSVMLPSLSGSRPTSTKPGDVRIPTKSIQNHSGGRLLDTSSSENGSVSGSQHSRRSIKSRKKTPNLIQQQQDQEQERRRLQQRQLRKLDHRRKLANKSATTKDFQKEDDKMSVTVRRIPVAERSAFDKKLPAYILHQGSSGILQSHSSSSLGGVSTATAGAYGKKVSPSWRHWSVLQQLSSVTHVRQLAFSSSVVSTVDGFREECEDDDGDGANDDPQPGGQKLKKHRSRRDGRYRSIDPVKATTAALPKAPPLLSNKKHRLPMRTDVGFSHASMEEITQKQAEIRRETEWEEASPRLVVLVTGDDLGTAVQEGEEGTDSSGNDTNDQNSAKRRRGLPNMPWAGRNLIQAKERNNRHFSRNQDQLPPSSVTSSSSSHKEEAERVTNMLAPPLDAIYSGTLGWRPRPFHDRPPGLRYTLVCPMSVHFSVGKMEPLVCSLALYSLQKGKISEEFYFPAGDWDGKLQLDAIQERSQNNISDVSDAGEEMEKLMQLWNKRKHKAIFAHNSWAFGEDEKGDVDNGDDNLYVVLQVYKVAHPDSIAAYWAKGDMNNTNNAYRKSDRKAWKKKLQKKFKNNSKKSKTFTRDGVINADESDVEKALLRSSAIFDAYGTQFMSPLCFGITGLFPEDSEPSSRHNTWPRGQVQQSMDLYLSPGHSESQDDFLKRLQKIVASTATMTTKNPMASTLSGLSVPSDEVPEGGIVEEDQSMVSMSVSGESFTHSTTTALVSPSKKRLNVRRIRTPKRITKKNFADPSPSKMIEDTPLIPGSVTLFTSNLDVDFLQSMLTTPPELIDKISIKSRTSDNKPKEVVLPRVLVDASGDSAIMVDPKKTVPTAKRSDLVRLPSIRLAEHLDSSEFREVLYLSPEPEKIFESSDHRSLLNLLYLYPKLLVLKSNENANKDISNRYTLRARLVRNVSSTTEDGIIENRNEVIYSFHNPASWGGSNLLQSVFTHIPRDNGDVPSFKRRQQDMDDPAVGIPLRDEFKMKLPTILDGTHFLQFSLFSVELHDYTDDSPGTGNYDSASSNSSGDDECGIILSPVAETTIPLSNASTRDPKTGVRATTIIPNSCHRLGLGKFQLHVETKLVSSIHVSDPAVAAALREFPVASSDGQQDPRSSMEPFTEMFIMGRLKDTKSVTSRGAENPTVKIPYPKLLATASKSALASHFQSLFFLHVRNLTKSGSGGQDIEASERFIIENMQSLLVLFQRVKTYFLSPGRDYDRRRLGFFVKATIDSFDELSYNSMTAQGHENEDDSASELHASESKRHSSELEIVNEDQEEKFDGGAIRRRTRASDFGIRLTRTYSTTEAAPEVTFSRVAYGASKNDHMLLEAELGGAGGRISTLFDDDETVASILTLKSTRNADLQQSESQQLVGVDSRYTFEEEKDAKSKDSVAASNSVSGEEKPKDSHDIDMAAFQQSISELQIGKRVKSAAQVMLAPCVTVTPALAAFLCRSPRNANVSIDISESKEDSNSLPNASSKMDMDLLEEELSQQIFQPGSDLDDDDAVARSDDVLFPYCTPQGIFRGMRKNSIQFEFTIKQYGYVNGRRTPLTRGSYVYESIMTLWLQSWSEYITNPEQNSSSNTGVAINFLGTGEEGNEFAKFYLQMDLLLPMILKSIVLRYGQASKSPKQNGARCILDKDHVYVFESFIEMLAIGLMGQAMTELQESTENGSLRHALNACDLIVDFIIGLLAVIHPAHMESFISKFVMTLRKCESDKNDASSLKWNEATLHRIKCSRQLRLRTVEKLAVLPNFVAINFPQRYSTKHVSSKTKKSTWIMQCEIEKLSGGASKRSEENLISDGLLPKAGWLATLLTNESLSICALSCETVVTEAMASMEAQDSKNDKTPQRSSRSGKPSLKRSDLLMFQSIAIHAISCVYELLLRRHAMDRRFQNESSRGRIAALFTKTIFDKSLASVRWISRMESTHRVRSIWLLCFVYILQEAPENLIREHIRSYCDPSDLKIHRFIRLLRLGSTTFQSFIDQQRHCMFPLEIDRGISPWLLQESFNTVCATTIQVVDESVSPTSSIPNEQRKMIQGILDLLLHVLTTPQSTVTHLRAVGGAIQAFEKFGAQMFLETTGGHLQHWIRIIVGLMNNTALSVRSIAVDFVVSLLCGVFDLHGNIEDVALIFATVLPEVVAREIALCSVNGLIKSFEDAEKSIWPLRRSFADIEDANPLDDDRVDPQLSPVLSVFCRASQAIIDGVLVEMRLRGDDCVVVGTQMPPKNEDKYIFDADEESLFEAASFFTPETSPMQRLRWLLTLKSLHVSKENWLEAAETLIMCARTISDSIPHLNNVWRPNRFSLWSDQRRSLWLSTVGEEIGNPEQGNVQVMTFANSFLEPEGLVAPDKKLDTLKLPRPTFPHMSSLLMSISKEAINMYGKEGGMDASAYEQLESLLRIVMDVLDDHEIASLHTSGVGLNAVLERKKYVEEVTCLRKVIASITAEMTKLAERLLLVAQDAPTSSKSWETSNVTNPPSKDGPYYVRLLLSGKKPRRFQESTSLPTFIEWDKPCICRVPKKIILEAVKSEKKSDLSEKTICNAFERSIRKALLQDVDGKEIVFRTGKPEPDGTNEGKLFVSIDVVRAECIGATKIGRQDGFACDYRRFLYSKPMDLEHGVAATFVRMTVAISFPCPLSRQRSMLTNELDSSSE
jgi:hypothetical protein